MSAVDPSLTFVPLETMRILATEGDLVDLGLDVQYDFSWHYHSFGMLFECVVAAASPTADATEEITSVELHIPIVWWKWLIANPLSKAMLLALTTLSEDTTTNTNPSKKWQTIGISSIVMLLLLVQHWVRTEGKGSTVIQSQSRTCVVRTDTVIIVDIRGTVKMSISCRTQLAL